MPRVQCPRSFVLLFINGHFRMRQPHFGCAGFCFPIFSQRIVFFHGHHGHRFFLSIIIVYNTQTLLYTILYVHLVSMNVFFFMDTDFFHGHRCLTFTICTTYVYSITPRHTLFMDTVLIFLKVLHTGQAIFGPKIKIAL